MEICVVNPKKLILGIGRYIAANDFPKVEGEWNLDFRFFDTFSAIFRLSRHKPVVSVERNWTTRLKPPPILKSLVTFSLDPDWSKVEYYIKGADHKKPKWRIDKVHFKLFINWKHSVKSCMIDVSMSHFVSDHINMVVFTIYTNIQMSHSRKELFPFIFARLRTWNINFV